MICKFVVHTAEVFQRVQNWTMTYTHWHMSTIVYIWWHLDDCKLMQLMKRQKNNSVNKHACVTNILAEKTTDGISCVP